MKIGITGQAGFVGYHLYNTLGLYSEFERVEFEDSYFSDEQMLRGFVKECDVIVHLAAMNRSTVPQVIYDTNMLLVSRLISAMEHEKVTPYILFTSSTQEERDNEYGKSKREGRELFERWAKENNASFSGLVIPNVFGPFGKPNYNSFIATFCHKLTHNELPEIKEDSNVRLIYVGSLCRYIVEKIRNYAASKAAVIEKCEVPYDFEERVSAILEKLYRYKEEYLQNGYIPELKDRNDINLFNTYRSYIEPENMFPVKLKVNSDERGVFVETIKMKVGGQVSFSTTVPGITRGNHFHTRKIERFTVIKGNAKIQLRRIGTEEVIDLYLDGNSPSYVDMPVWYTHNITNIGEEELYTLFWINEWYDPQDADTFYEPV